MKRAIFMTSIKSHIANVYDATARENMRKYFDITDDIYTKADLAKGDFRDVKAIFATWGMEHFDIEDIKKYFPALECVYYGAGSVQDFAKEFLECGVRVFSAAAANAIPVIEYTFGEILLANKGMFQAHRRSKLQHYLGNVYSNGCKGNYKPTIGIIGAGKIGRGVIALLKNIECDIWYYDPFLPKEVADELGITSKSLEEIFSGCDCISNHLANKDELTGIFTYELFSKMKPYATFINTGRGRQVNEKGLIKALKECKTRTAVLDVTFPEPPRPFSPLKHMRNVYLTPHIAGSTGGEIARMGEYMVADATRIETDGEPLYEVKIEMLATLA